MRIALVREVSPKLADCELTHLSRQEIDVDLARSQHQRYTDCLAALGCEVQTLVAEPDLPDSVFVEDTAVVLDEIAIITRPGAASRRPETPSVARALEPYRKLRFIESPATLDGGDVLRIGKRIFIGLSSRSNDAAIEQVRAYAEPFDYRVLGVSVKGCLHLKSAVTQVAENTVLLNRRLIDAAVFAGFEIIDVDDMEPLAANALLVGESVIYPTSYPRTLERLEERGILTVPVEVSELIKAEGAVTCCSLIFNKYDFKEAGTDE